ncbi:MAG: hypothetical protein K0B10_06265 [Vicingaceae bacterium]|nr:hypothetical protein [Vicingaceae bacterium]
MSKNDNAHLYFNTNNNELKLKIIPFETDKTTFDLNDSISSLHNFIYVGKAKDQYLSEKLSKDEFYIQINDVISSPEAIPEFLDCSHCDFEKYKIIIEADKSTPIDFLKEIESKILHQYSEYKSSQIYYYEVNSSIRISGYNRKNFTKETKLFELGNGYNELYNEAKKISKVGEFKNYKLINGLNYNYDEDYNLIDIQKIKDGGLLKNQLYPKDSINNNLIAGNLFFPTIIRLEQHKNHFIYYNGNKDDLEFLTKKNREKFYVKSLVQIDKNDLKAHKLAWSISELNAMQGNSDGELHTIITMIEKKP